MNEASEIELLSITERFVAAQEAGKHPRMADYIRCYPQYADEIADFVTYYFAMETDLPQPDAIVPPVSLDTQEALKRGWVQAGGVVGDDSGALLALARVQHVSLSRLAITLDLSVDLVAQLTNRQFDPATLPYELLRRLAQVLALPTNKVQQSLGVMEGQKKQMVAELPLSYILPARQSFRQAIANSSLLSATQKENWQFILEGEGL